MHAGKPVLAGWGFRATEFTEGSRAAGAVRSAAERFRSRSASRGLACKGSGVEGDDVLIDDFLGKRRQWRRHPDTLAKTQEWLSLRRARGTRWHKEKRERERWP
jgi:hypothetical protein